MTATGDAHAHDLILRGARVIDPSQNLDRVTDVRFTGGKVVAIGDPLSAGPGTEVRDLHGKIVTPGLIDLHTQVYWGGTSIAWMRWIRHAGAPPPPSSMPAPPVRGRDTGGRDTGGDSLMFHRDALGRHCGLARQSMAPGSSPG